MKSIFLRSILIFSFCTSQLVQAEGKTAEIVEIIVGITTAIPALAKILTEVKRFSSSSTKAGKSLFQGLKGSFRAHKRILDLEKEVKKLKKKLESASTKESYQHQIDHKYTEIEITKVARAKGFYEVAEAGKSISSGFFDLLATLSNTDLSDMYKTVEKIGKKTKNTKLQEQAKKAQHYLENLKEKAKQTSEEGKHAQNEIEKIEGELKKLFGGLKDGKEDLANDTDILDKVVSAEANNSEEQEEVRDNIKETIAEDDAAETKVENYIHEHGEISDILEALPEISPAFEHMESTSTSHVSNKGGEGITTTEAQNVTKTFKTLKEAEKHLFKRSKDGYFVFDGEVVEIQKGSIHAPGETPYSFAEVDEEEFKESGFTRKELPKFDNLPQDMMGKIRAVI